MKVSLSQHIREIVSDLLVIALGAILILHFILFWFFEWILVGEPNKIILTVETVMAVGIFLLGWERYIDDIRRIARFRRR